MTRTLKAYNRGIYQTLSEAAWTLRNNTKELGRRIDQRVISRTLLVKGLEFDHSIVLNADELDTKNLYVAMTRGAKSLTVLSSSPIFQP
jgi:DNA helicase-2/ATP-dependent DNA helicase PcrA